MFAQPDHASAMVQLREVATLLAPRFPQAAELLEEAAEDVLAHLHFPREHRRRLHSTNPIERLHKEIKRRTRVVGIFPNRDSLMRMVGTLLAEQDDEWQVADRRYFSVSSMTKVDELEGGEDPKELRVEMADPDRARELLEGVQPVPLGHEHVLVTCRATLAEAAGSLEEAAALYADAEQRWAAFPSVLERGHALFGQGRCARALGRPDAESFLLEARSVFASLGAGPSVVDVDRIIASGVAQTS